jgi:hypothetical protein
MKMILYQIGRLLQLIGMVDLLYDMVSAGPMGPSPKIFAVGIIVFLGGWGLTRVTR